MELVQIVGIIFAAVVILVIAYLYRESKRISGKAKVEVGPVKVELGGEAEKQADVQTLPAQAPAAPAPGLRENLLDNESKIDTVEGVEISDNVLDNKSAITVHERKNK